MTKKALLILLTLNVTFLLSSCGGLSRVSSLRAVDFMTGARIEVPVRFRHGYHSGHSTDIGGDFTISELATRLQGLSSAGQTIYITEFPNEHLLVEVSTNQQTYVTIVSKSKKYRPSSGEPPFLYTFSSPAVYVNNQSGNLILPLHLVDDISLRHWYNSLELGKNYRTPYSAQEFLDFYLMMCRHYTALNAYDIEVVDGGFILESSFMPGGSSAYRITFQFHQETSGNFFSVDLTD